MDVTTQNTSAQSLAGAPSVTQNASDSAARKQVLREEKHRLRSSLDASFRRCADFAINSHLLSLLNRIPCSLVVCYLSDGLEPDLRPFMTEVRRWSIPLSVPRFVSRTRYDIVMTEDLVFSNSKWGIPEPSADAPCASETLLDSALWIVPGLAFDAQGMRLGRGGGIFDRLLTDRSGTIAGIFYECQKCDAVPAEPHDRPLDLVVTETGIHVPAPQNNSQGAPYA